MLPLDNPRWKDLQHAYGDAADIPHRRRSLASSTGPKQSYRDEPWFSLWSSLCHQGNVYTASYVAVPHIVQIASEAKGPIDCSFFQLPAAVEVARKTGRGPDIPEIWASDYRHAIGRLMVNINLYQNEPRGR